MLRACAAALGDHRILDADPAARDVSASSRAPPTVPEEQRLAREAVRLARHARGHGARPPRPAVSLAQPARPEAGAEVSPRVAYRAVAERPQEVGHLAACTARLDADASLAARDGDVQIAEPARHLADRPAVLEVVDEGAVRLEDALQRPLGRHQRRVEGTAQ